MAKDYAHRGRGNKGHGSKAGRKSPPRKKKQAADKPGMPGWIWMLLGLTAGLLIAVLAYIFLVPAERQPIANKQQGSAGEQTASARPNGPANAAASANLNPAPTMPPREQPRFTFYELLPNQKLVPRNESYTPEPSVSRANAKWVIQAGSFAKKSDAERRKAEIALLGYQSDVNRAELPSGGTTYRVTIGPDGDYDRVRGRMARLLENEIDVFFKRVS